MGRTAGGLFCAGGALSLIGDLLPHSPQANVTAFWVIGTLTLLLGFACLRWSKHLPGWTYPPLMVYATTLISVAVYFDGERIGGRPVLDEVLYVWIALYFGYFFTRRQIIFQTVAIAIAYALALVEIHPGPSGVTRWTIVVMMVSLVATAVHLLKRQSDSLVAELNRWAHADPITGLLNRRGFDQQLELELARASRLSFNVALLLCDLDRLKLVNDTFGHAAGDAALAAVASTLLNGVRLTDTAARIGGDEFALLLPGSSANDAVKLAQRLSEAISGLRDPGSETLSASFGVAEFPRDATTTTELLATADSSLYLAKHARPSRATMQIPDQTPDLQPGRTLHGVPSDRSPTLPADSGGLTVPIRAGVLTVMEGAVGRRGESGASE
jgi:diguanylate cyclase (GGDEF)-like protein